MNAVEDAPGARNSPDREPVHTREEPQISGRRQAPRTIPSEDLFGPDRMVVIEHGGDRYRLMITRNGKLILQK